MLMAKEVSQMLAQRAQDVAMKLLPNGKKHGTEWCAGDIYGNAGESLKVHLTGEKAGVWCDFATGERGDLLDLWAMSNMIPIADALRHACNYLGVKSPTPYKKQEKHFSKPKIELKITSMTSPVFIYLTQQRGLTQDIIEDFFISSHNGDIAFPSYHENKVVSVKYLKLERQNGKKSMYVEKDCQPCLFGWQAIPNDARYVVLCEGEIDAMSMYQYGHPALSVPFGAGTGKKHEWIEYEFDRIAYFDEIYLCMDNDEEGEKATAELIERLGAHRCKILQLPMKDVNECLVNGISAEDITYCMQEAKSINLIELKPHSDFDQETFELIHPVPGKFLGYKLGWEKLEDRILFRPSGLSLWTGYNGHGKSLFLGLVALNMIKQGAKVCIASMELHPSEVMARMYMQMTASRQPSIPYLETASKALEERLYLFNLVGTAKIEKLLEVFLYARRKYAVDVFIVDSLTTLNIAEDDYNGQKELTETLRDFKIAHNCHIHLVAHPRKPRDEKEIPGKYDIRGGGAISDLADNCFSVWRNKEKEAVARKEQRGDIFDEKELELLAKPDVLLKCDKNRHGYGLHKEGISGFWFDEPSLQYLENDSKKPTPFVYYSCLD